jgi:peptidase inhibitor I78 family protein
MRPAAGLVLALGLAACSSTPSYPTTPPAAPTPSAPPPVAAAPKAPPQRSPIPGAQASNEDQCGAAAMQGLVGRPRTQIPVPVDPNRQRVACMTCPVTLDYNPGRLNFFFDADTGVIKKISCG